MTREEAITILTETQVVYFAPNGKEKVQKALNMAIEALTDRPKGEWIKYESPVNYDDGKDAWDCSLCGAMVGKQTNYCPNCGADMKGDDNK